MMMLRIAAIAIIFTGILAGMVGQRIALLENGRQITVKIEPIDPRDLFRGDFVILSYAMSLIRTDVVNGDDEFEEGERLFAVLAPSNEDWKVQSIHRSLAQAQAALTGREIVLRGRINNLWEHTPSRPTATPSSDSEFTDPSPPEGGYCETVCKEIFVQYGVESYFVPEGQGHDLEDKRQENRMAVTLAVGQNGEAAIKALLIDQSVVYEEGLF
jgi:uncharacterized membrane-anchored protein